MSDIVIQLNTKIDRKTIHADTTIDIVNNYASEALPLNTFKYSDLSGSEKEALNEVLDKLTYETEGGAIVWNVFRTDKIFDLRSSYVRDAQSTETPTTDIPDGTAMMVRFEVAGFVENTYREVSLWYNEDFLTPDLDALAEIGITITGNGRDFEITNNLPCKVSFIKPGAVSDFYIINDVEQSQIIPK